MVKSHTVACGSLFREFLFAVLCIFLLLKFGMFLRKLLTKVAINVRIVFVGEMAESG